MTENLCASKFLLITVSILAKINEFINLKKVLFSRIGPKNYHPE